ncbi:MAG: glycosyltransferase family 2 protein [Deltaproteobacteria bacterium]|nr:glycosyltransferase family 2 protein [Deltaproteobacteria bacterium]
MSSDRPLRAGADGFTLSVIVPALDEAPCIDTVLRGVMATPSIEEVLVVDGGSRDGTLEIVQARVDARRDEERPQLRLLRQSTPGFGPGLWEAFERARGDLLCIVDADGSHDWRDIPKMRRRIAAGADYVLGSRYRGPFRWRGPLRWPWSTSEDDSWFHEWGNLGIVLLARALHGYPLSDVMMGLQMWRRSNFERVTLSEKSQAFEAELKLRTLSAGYVMEEFTTHERKRIGGEAKLHALRDGAATLEVILSLWWARRRGRGDE